MDLIWLAALALLALQALFVAASLVGLCLPLKVDYARLIHKHCLLIMVLGLFAAFLPLVYFALTFEAGTGLYYLKYLAASILLALAQVLLYLWEDKRTVEKNPDSRMRM